MRVWSTTAATQVTARAAVTTKTLTRPRFGRCTAVRETTCAIGTLRAGHAARLTITDQLRRSAAPGAQFTVTIAVSASGFSPADASVTAVVDRPTPSPTPSIPVPTGTPLPPPPQPSSITPGNLSSLFPVVTPGPTRSSGPPPPASGSRRTARYVPTASATPIDLRLIGGQLTALAILAVAVTMAVARLSLRKPVATRETPKAPAEPVSPDAVGERD